LANWPFSDGQKVTLGENSPFPMAAEKLSAKDIFVDGGKTIGKIPT
jgi:hypothetical protein